MIGPESVIKHNLGRKHLKTKLYVRYKVSLRCNEIVKEELKKLKIDHSILPHGAIEFFDDVTEKQLSALKRNLQKSGLDLLNVHESKLIDRLITTIIDVVHSFDVLPKLTYTEIITDNVFEADKPFLKIFAEVVGVSVIQFIILQKVERIKELLLYDDIPLSEIARNLNYKNENYLVAQFRKCTGLNPDYFIKLKEERMKIASKRSSYASRQTSKKHV
ncbi:MAG: AraC family transcriptional regulator [Balneolaceae bacterium]|nr:AraC family transcriptional regulator [Balneolaceae bacterium]